MENQNILAKQEKMKKLFALLPTKEAIYEEVIALGSKLPPLDKKYQTEEYLVQGCQSRLYLRAFREETLVRFEIHSEALISAGLAALLLLVYDKESAETILKTPPDYIKELGILENLSLGRSSGLRSLHLKMQQETARIYLETSKVTGAQR